MDRTIDLNADVGEGVGEDAPLLAVVSSANIACGFHAGDATTMHRTLVAAKAGGIRNGGVGAHPSFDDRAGFGRREMTLSDAEVEVLVAYQIGALMGLAAHVGMSVAHVKPHGALYTMAARDSSYAMAIGRAIRAIDRGLVYVGQADSEMVRAADRLGLACAREAFPDRGYGDDGLLLPRGRDGAIISHPATVAGRALRMARDGVILSTTGKPITAAIDTLCIHGDATGAIDIARAVRAALDRAGVKVAPLSTAR